MVVWAVVVSLPLALHHEKDEQRDAQEDDLTNRDRDRDRENLPTHTLASTQTHTRTDARESDTIHLQRPRPEQQQWRLQRTPVYELLTALLSRLLTVWLMATLLRPYSCISVPMSDGK